MIFELFTEKVGESMGSFEIYQDASNQWRFRLKAANNEIISASEAARAQMVLNLLGDMRPLQNSLI